MVNKEGRPELRSRSSPRFQALEFISGLSKEYLELSAEADLYAFIAGKILDVIGKGMIVIGSPTRDTRLFCIRCLLASEEGMTEKFSPNLREKSFEVVEPFRNSLLGGKLFNIRTHRGRGLSPWVMEAVSTWEERVGPLSTYAIGFVWREELLGVALAIVPKTERMKNGAMVETLARLASTAIRRNLAEAALRESEVKYRQLVKHAPSGIFEVDFHKGRFVSVNDIMCEYTGYSKKEFLAMSPFDILTEESKKIFAERVRRLSVGETVPETVEFKIRAKDGREFWVILNARFFWEEGAIGRATVIVHNITEIKAAQEALRESEARLRILSSRLINAQEEERKRISRELHDELGQDLMVLKLRMRSLQEDMERQDPDRFETLDQILRYINGIAENVRRLSRNLSPAILEDLGLVAAIRWLFGESAKLYQFDIEEDVEDMAGLFTPENETIIYRIVQEALTNVGKHAQASRVRISATAEDGRCILLFEDDGKGFDVEAVRSGGAGPRGFGLTTMQERARMLGSWLAFDSRQGKGTRIRLEIPLK